MEGMDRTCVSGLFRDIISFPCHAMAGLPEMKSAPHPDNTPPDVPVPDYRPVERFWPYVNLPEQPTPEELASLNPELSQALFGTSPLPFSVSIEFPHFDGPDYPRALEMARASSEYREIGTGLALRHRARFYPDAAVRIRDLFDIVGRFDATEVLLDDRPVPYARELWLPLLWFLIR
jgi:hypothetical protein